MNRTLQCALAALAATLICATTASAAILVNDTWRDGTRTDPASTTYAENNGSVGNDADVDGDQESAWFRGGSGSMSVVNATPNVTPGVLRKVVANNASGGASSASWTTYFTPDVTPVTLANAGDTMRITWVFSLGNVNTGDTGQGFRMAIVESPNAARVAADASPGNGAYAGYGMFLNMATTIGNANPFQLFERTDPLTASALLSASASWTSLDDEEVTGTTGYANSTTYTYVFTATRTAAAELSIVASMAGGSVGGDGQLDVSFVDASPNSFTFDTFALRPAGIANSAETFDTSLFRVEFTAVPEPASLTLVSLAGLAALAFRRRR